MAKVQRGLGAKGWIDRAVEKYGSVRVVAEKLGRAPSTISAIRSGKRPGASLRDAARDLARGKRKPIPPPSSRGKPAKVSKHPNAQKLAKAHKALLRLDAKGVDKVVIYVNLPGAGKSLTLGAHGGIPIDQILSATSLKAFLEDQAERQRYKLNLLPDDDSEPGSEDWEDTDLIDSIEFEEYN